MAILYIVATPIGNLSDFTFRAIETLKKVDLILCEDTKRTKKLLEHYQIKNQTLSYHQHSSLQKINYIINLLSQGKTLALVSDAGTPGISDPGNKLIELLFKDFKNPITIIPIPGPSAITAAASISGFPMDKFIFMGFPPSKRKRRKFFEEIKNSKQPVIFYESPHRILKTLKELLEFDELKNTDIVISRELTKKFETIYRGKIEEIFEKIKKNKIKGEFVIIINKKIKKELNSLDNP